jgi:hypothetical protein
MPAWQTRWAAPPLPPLPLLPPPLLVLLQLLCNPPLGRQPPAAIAGAPAAGTGQAWVAPLRAAQWQAPRSAKGKAKSKGVSVPTLMLLAAEARWQAAIQSARATVESRSPTAKLTQTGVQSASCSSRHWRRYAIARIVSGSVITRLLVKVPWMHSTWQQAGRCCTSGAAC